MTQKKDTGLGENVNDQTDTLNEDTGTSDELHDESMWGAIEESFDTERGEEISFDEDDHDEQNDHSDPEDDENYDEVDEGYDEKMEKERKKKKLKAYALMGVVLAATGSLVGGGLLLSGSGGSAGGDYDGGFDYSNAPMVQSAPVDQSEELRALTRSPLEVDIVESEDVDLVIENLNPDLDQTITDGEQQQTGSDTIIVKGDNSYDYESADMAMVEDKIQRRNASELFDEVASLNEKSELLAAGLVKLEQNAQKSNEQTQKLITTSDDHATRIAALEAALKKQAPTPVKKSPAKPKPAPAAKPATRVAVTKKATAPSAPESSIRITEIKIDPSKEPKSSVTLSAPASYKVVGVYPSERMGVAPQKAWVTNGENLVELIVGSTLNGARVTKIEGSTVFTNKGSIK